MTTTEAWVLCQRPQSGTAAAPESDVLRLAEYSFPDIGEQEVLAEPIYGCWEGNMMHALRRKPIDVCRARGEERVVIGNAGVVRILRTGSSVKTVREGDLCLVFCNGVWDELGYAKKIFAYDAPNTVGLLAKQTKLHEKQIIPIPEDSPFSLKQWAAFSLRYITAWANWKVAYGSWGLQVGPRPDFVPFVWGWGGGVALAELSLARLMGCEVAMISSSERRLQFIRNLGMLAIDRRRFEGLNFDPARYESDSGFKKAYLESEEVFLETVNEHTRGRRVSIFVDFIGLPVYRATLKALGRPGVITTAGWKQGMNLSTIRAIECMNWHIHVHTHYARYHEALEAVRFGMKENWMPAVSDEVYSWASIPKLIEDYANARISSYFPIFEVNPL